MSVPIPEVVRISGNDAPVVGDSVTVPGDNYSPDGVVSNSHWGDWVPSSGFNGRGKIISSCTSRGCPWFDVGRA